MYTKCTEFVVCNSMNNILSYCGLVDASIRASDKDLPVFMTLPNWSYAFTDWNNENV